MPSSDVRVPPNRYRDRLHTILFWVVAHLGRPARRAFLRAYFQFMHREPSHWGYDTSDYERTKVSRYTGRRSRDPILPRPEPGCSEGAFSELLLAQRTVHHFVGLDISPRAIQRARTRLTTANVEFVVGDLLSDPLPGRFELVVCAELLYYLGPANTALVRRIADLLTTGGLLVLVHPIDRAPALHPPFLRAPQFTVVRSHVTEDATRPVELLVLRRT